MLQGAEGNITCGENKLLKEKFPKLTFFLEHFRFELSVRAVFRYKPVSKMTVEREI